MKKQRNEKPIDEELLMRMMAGEAAGTGEPGTGKGETAVPVEKAQEGKAAETRRRKGRQADYETTFLKGMDIPARYGKPVALVRKRLELLALEPKYRALVKSGDLSVSHAVAMAQTHRWRRRGVAGVEGEGAAPGKGATRRQRVQRWHAASNGR